MYTLILSLFLTSPSIDEAVKLSRSGNYEESDKILKKISPKENIDTYNFYRLVNAYSLNKKKEATKLAEEIIHSFTEVPQRHHDLAMLMLADMDTWKAEDDDLGDISREMKKITDRLNNRKGGKETQKMQKEVEERLARMIKKLEDEQDAKKKEKESGSEQEKDSQEQPRPAPDTIRPQEKGTGVVEKKRIKNTGDVWGKLQAKDRAKITVGTSRPLPARDRALYEAYIRELAKRSGK